MNPVHRVCLECESEYPSLPSLSLFLFPFDSLIEGSVSPFLFPVSSFYPLALFQTFSLYSLATTISISSSLPLSHLLTLLFSLSVVAIQKRLTSYQLANQPLQPCKLLSRELLHSMVPYRYHFHHFSSVQVKSSRVLPLPERLSTVIFLFARSCYIDNFMNTLTIVEMNRFSKS